MAFEKRPFFVFQAPRCNLLTACLDLPRGGFGMVLEAKDYDIARWEISLGGAEHGEKIKAGQEVRSPQFVFALDASEDVYPTTRLYHDLLVQWGFIPDPKTLPRRASRGGTTCRSSTTRIRGCRRSM
jgi:hypothetical protein